MGWVSRRAEPADCLRRRHHLSEGWDLSMANSSLVWHMKTKALAAHTARGAAGRTPPPPTRLRLPPAQAPGRIGLVHDWAQDHHCHPSADELIIRCMRHWASCNGADWLRCAESPESIARCSKQKISLKDRMRKGLWAPQSREHQ